jgi:hypothetical protein
MANNLKCGVWAKKLSEEFNKIGLGYIWHDPEENCVVCYVKKHKERCNGVE